MPTGSVDYFGIVMLARDIEHHTEVIGQHAFPGEADDRVERRAQLVTHGGGEKAALGGIKARADPARTISMARSCDFRSLTSRSTATTSAACQRLTRPLSGSSGRAAHFDPNEMTGVRGVVSLPRRMRKSTERAFAEGSGIGERRQIGRAIGYVHAIEQAMPAELRPPAPRTSGPAAGMR